LINAITCARVNGLAAAGLRFFLAATCAAGPDAGAATGDATTAPTNASTTTHTTPLQTNNRKLPPNLIATSLPGRLRRRDIDANRHPSR
jgi:hypothetical protein